MPLYRVIGKQDAVQEKISELEVSHSKYQTQKVKRKNEVFKNCGKGTKRCEFEWRRKKEAEKMFQAMVT